MAEEVVYQDARQVWREATQRQREILAMLGPLPPGEYHIRVTEDGRAEVSLKLAEE